MISSLLFIVIIGQFSIVAADAVMAFWSEDRFNKPNSYYLGAYGVVAGVCVKEREKERERG